MSNLLVSSQIARSSSLSSLGPSLPPSPLLTPSTSQQVPVIKTNGKGGKVQQKTFRTLKLLRIPLLELVEKTQTAQVQQAVRAKTKQMSAADISEFRALGIYTTREKVVYWYEGGGRGRKMFTLDMYLKG